jgi:hypothetical protein
MLYILGSSVGRRIEQDQSRGKSWVARWERTRLGKNVNKNVNKQRKTRDLRSATAAHNVARMSPGRLNGRDVVSDVLLLNNVYGT